MKTKQLYKRYIEQKSRLEQEVKSGEWKHFGSNDFSKRISSFDGIANELQKAGLHVSTFAGLGLLAFPLNDMQGQCIPNLIDYGWENIDWTEGITTNDQSKAAFVDLDGDGDLDMVVNGLITRFYDYDNYGYDYPYNQGILRYFENTGDASNPIFVERFGTDNPFDDIRIGSYNYPYPASKLAPAFTDIDGDGDQDLFIGCGETYGYIYQFNNIGDPNNPIFSSSYDNYYYLYDGQPVLAFADVDNDGDEDLAIGFKYGYTLFVANIDTSYPYFSLLGVLPNSIPGNLGSGYYGEKAAPTLADFDCDGDQDLVLGFYDNYDYFPNIGNSNNKMFMLEENGFLDFELIPELSDILSSFRQPPEYYLRPTAADLDNDGDFDIVYGENNGTLRSLEAVRRIPIPTMSQWGIIILGMMVSILGLLGIRQRNWFKKTHTTATMIALLLSLGFGTSIMAQGSDPVQMNIGLRLDNVHQFESYVNSSEFKALLNKYKAKITVNAAQENIPMQRVIGIEFESLQKARRFRREVMTQTANNRHGVKNAAFMNMKSLFQEEMASDDQFMIGMYRVQNVETWYQSFDKKAVESKGMKIRSISVEQHPGLEKRMANNPKIKTLKAEGMPEGKRVVILYELTHKEKAIAAASNEGFKAEMKKLGLDPVRNRSGFFISK